MLRSGHWWKAYRRKIVAGMLIGMGLMGLSVAHAMEASLGGLMAGGSFFPLALGAIILAVSGNSRPQY